jgi:hypothetical protein
MKRRDMGIRRWKGRERGKWHDDSFKVSLCCLGKGSMISISRTGPPAHVASADSNSSSCLRERDLCNLSSRLSSSSFTPPTPLLFLLFDLSTNSSLKSVQRHPRFMSFPIVTGIAPWQSAPSVDSRSYSNQGDGLTCCSFRSGRVVKGENRVTQ